MNREFSPQEYWGTTAESVAAGHDDSNDARPQGPDSASLQSEVNNELQSPAFVSRHPRPRIPLCLRQGIRQPSWHHNRNSYGANRAGATRGGDGGRDRSSCGQRIE